MCIRDSSTIQGTLTGGFVSTTTKVTGETIGGLTKNKGQADPVAGDMQTVEEQTQEQTETAQLVGDEAADATVAPVVEEQETVLQLEYQPPMVGDDEVVSTANPVDVINSIPEEELALVPTVNFAVDQTDRGFRVVSLPDGYAVTPTFRTREEADQARQRLFDRVVEDQEARDKQQTEEIARLALQETKQKETTELLNTAREASQPYEPISLGEITGAVGSEKGNRIYGEVTRNTDKDRIYLGDIEQARQEIGLDQNTGEMFITEEDMIAIQSVRQPASARVAETDTSFEADAIINEAKRRNIDTNHESFGVFARRVTGVSDVRQMTPTQRAMFKEALERLNNNADFDTRTRIPIIETPPYSREDFSRAAHNVRHSDEWVESKKPRKKGSEETVPNKLKPINRAALDRIIKKGLIIEEELVPEVAINEQTGEVQETGRLIDPLTQEAPPLRMDEDVAVLREELVRRGVVKGVGEKNADGSFNRYELRRTVAYMPTPGGAASINSVNTAEEVTERSEQAVLNTGISNAVLEKIVKGLRKKLRARGLDKVGLVIQESLALYDDQGNVDVRPQGEYVVNKDLARFIILALDAIPESIQGDTKKVQQYLSGVFDHETIHALVEMLSLIHI